MKIEIEERVVDDKVRVIMHAAWDQGGRAYKSHVFGDGRDREEAIHSLLVEKAPDQLRPALAAVLKEKYRGVDT